MPKKKFTATMEKGFVGERKGTRKPREVDSTILDDYTYRRDMSYLTDLHTSEETKSYIRKKYNLV